METHAVYPSPTPRQHHFRFKCFVFSETPHVLLCHKSQQARQLQALDTVQCRLLRAVIKQTVKVLYRYNPAFQNL